MQFRRRWKRISENKYGDPLTCRCCPVNHRAAPPALSPRTALGFSSSTCAFPSSSQSSFACGPGSIPLPWLGPCVSSVPACAEPTLSDSPASQIVLDPGLLSHCLSLSICFLPFFSVCPSVCAAVPLSLCLSPPTSLVISCLSTNTCSFLSCCSFYRTQAQPDYSSS